MNRLRRLLRKWFGDIRRHAPVLKAIAAAIVLALCWPKFLGLVVDIARLGLFSLTGLGFLITLAALLWHVTELAKAITIDLSEEAEGLWHDQIATWPLALAIALTMVVLLFYTLNWLFS